MERKAFSIYNRSFGKDFPLLARHGWDFQRWLKLAATSPYTKDGCMYRCIVKYERPGHYYLILPYVHKIATKKGDAHPDNVSVVALDPGVRIFQTAYDNKGQVTKYGEGDAKRLFSVALKADKLISEVATNKGLNQSIIRKQQSFASAKTRKVYRKNARRRMKQRVRGLYAKMDHLKKDAHWKVAKDLCTRYDHILIPTFETSQMVKRITRRINSETVRKMMHWSHYEFRQKLKHTALKMGVQVHEVSEAYTTKGCGKCGRLHHKIGGNTLFECPHCSYRAARDPHSSRMIMAMNVQAYVGEVL
jgi:putative transposase